MYRKLTLSTLLLLGVFLSSNRSFAITYVDNGTAITYTINAGDSLYIASGTYTGQVKGLGSVNAKITINSGATFQPSSIPNSVVATINNYGTVIFDYALKTNTNFILNNYGIFSVTGITTIVGNNQTWTNNVGGIMNFYADVTVNGNLTDVNNTFINYQTVNCTGTFKMNSGSAFYNYKMFAVTGTFQANGGILENQGKMEVTGNILMNSGTSVIKNFCSMKATNGINNTNGSFYNYSFLWAVNSDISNSAIIINAVFNHSTPMMQGRNFTLSTGGSITGPCLMYFEATTSHTGGTIGVPGTTTDTIKVYDITRTQPTQIFDVQSGGTRYPNVIYNAWGAPDPNYVWYWGCSMEVILEIPLAISWNYFNVYLSNEVPVLNWSAYSDQGTVFQVQRSYDGKNFDDIKNVAAELGRTDYSYNDISFNKNSLLVYYRIKAIEPGGNEKFSQVRMVRFNSKPGNIKIAPNPFTSNFVIDYNAKENEDVIVRIFNSSGQQKMSKSISVHSGSNLIDIREADNFSKGIYIVQITNGTNNIATSKLIKQ